MNMLSAGAGRIFCLAAGLLFCLQNNGYTQALFDGAWANIN